MQLEDDETAERIMDAYLPLEYRKFYEGLPAQMISTPSAPTKQQMLEWNKEKDLLQSPGANTVSTVASSVVSSLTPPFVDEDHPSHRRASGRDDTTIGLRTALRASLLRECEQRRHPSLSGGTTSSIGKLQSKLAVDQLRQSVMWQSTMYH